MSSILTPVANFIKIRVMMRKIDLVTLWIIMFTHCPLDIAQDQVMGEEDCFDKGLDYFTQIIGLNEELEPWPKRKFLTF